MFPGVPPLFSAGTFQLVYAANTVSRTILTDALAAGYDGSSDLKVVINPGVVICSTSTSIAALDTGAISAGVTLDLINNGIVCGLGGVGGNGGNASGSGVVGSGGAGSPGFAGGNAFNISTSAIIKITNASGSIGGGGGGGGGGCGGDNANGNQGGGGGGGGGQGAPGFSIVSGGSGYTAGDTLTASGGSVSNNEFAQIIVDTVSGGVITSAHLHPSSVNIDAGAYITLPTSPVSVTGGTGSGATFNMTGPLGGSGGAPNSGGFPGFHGFFGTTFFPGGANNGGAGVGGGGSPSNPANGGAGGGWTIGTGGSAGTVSAGLPGSGNEWYRRRSWKGHQSKRPRSSDYHKWNQHDLRRDFLSIVRAKCGAFIALKSKRVLHQ